MQSQEIADIFFGQQRLVIRRHRGGALRLMLGGDVLNAASMRYLIFHRFLRATSLKKPISQADDVASPSFQFKYLLLTLVTGTA